MSGLILLCAAILLGDGDSGSCREHSGARTPIRLAGIDAGEVAPYSRCRNRPRIWACSAVGRATAPLATRRARELAAGGGRCSVVDRDRYGRLVAICTANGRDIGRTLVREGLAINDLSYRNLYPAEQRAAMRDRLGAWQ